MNGAVKCYRTKLYITKSRLYHYDYLRSININKASMREDYSKNNTNIKVSDLEKSLNRTKNNIKMLIESNVTKYSKFVTLTFKENINDYDYAKKCFSKFQMMFRYYFKENLKYVGVMELQKRGAVHFHLVVFNNKKLDIELLKKCWTFGIFDIKIIDKVENIGLYLMKYITKDFIIDKEKKRILRSQHLQKPLIVYDCELEHINNEYKEVYKKTYEWNVEDNGILLKNSCVLTELQKK